MIEMFGWTKHFSECNEITTMQLLLTIFWFPCTLVLELLQYFFCRRGRCLTDETSQQMIVLQDQLLLLDEKWLGAGIKPGTTLTEKL